MCFESDDHKDVHHCKGNINYLYLMFAILSGNESTFLFNKTIIIINKKLVSFCVLTNIWDTLMGHDLDFENLKEKNNLKKHFDWHIHDMIWDRLRLEKKMI